MTYPLLMLCGFFVRFFYLCGFLCTKNAGVRVFYCAVNHCPRTYSTNKIHTQFSVFTVRYFPQSVVSFLKKFYCINENVTNLLTSIVFHTEYYGAVLGPPSLLVFWRSISLRVPDPPHLHLPLLG